MKSSESSPPFSATAGWREIVVVAVCLALLVTLAAIWCYRGGYILYYGDGQAHLNISRRIFDSLTPGYEQIGTVWLPVLHLICLPFVGNDWLWQTGLSATIPVAACFVVSGVFLYMAARTNYGDRRSASVVVSCYALNPNLLYLSCIPMTEAVFLAALSVVIYALVQYRNTNKNSLVALAGAASCVASMTRYDGWFLIPFIAASFLLLSAKNRLTSTVLFCSIASLGPIYWICHNAYFSGSALAFYNGPGSAMDIQGGKDYPGFHDWIKAIRYYCQAGRLCVGLPLILLGLGGAACAIRKRLWMPLAFLLLTPLFYIWSMHSSGNPIFMPTDYPFSYYNTRYGIAVLPLMAFSAGALVLLLPRHRKHWASAITALAILPWILHPSKENWVCWKESKVNSDDRRAWTNEAAEFLRSRYKPGQGILMQFGDLTGILCKLGMPIEEDLHEGNGPAFLLATTRPELYHPQQWAIAQEKTPLAAMLEHSQYRLVHEVLAPHAPLLKIYRRNYQIDANRSLH